MANISQKTLDTLHDIPFPQAGNTGKKMGVAAFLAVVLVGGLAFWFTRPPEVQDSVREDVSKLREEAAKMVDDATKGTPLAGSGKYLREAPAPPPTQILHPPTNSGTLAGPVIRGQSGLEGMLLPDGSFRKPNQPVLAKVQEDSRLKRRFIDEVADYIVRQYTPDARGGRLALSLQSLNQFCGMRLNTEGGGGRTAFMRYAFHPTMLKGLYQLYVDSFLQRITAKAEEKWDQRAVASLYALLAGRLSQVGAAMDCLLKDKSLDASLRNYEECAEQCETVRAQHTMALFDLEQLKEKKSSASEKKALEKRVDELGVHYRQSLEKRDMALRTMIDPIKNRLTRNLDDDTLLFLALWIRRRLELGVNAPLALNAAKDILTDLSSRFTRLAVGDTGQSPSSSPKNATPSQESHPLDHGSEAFLQEGQTVPQENGAGHLGQASLVDDTALAFPNDGDIKAEEKRAARFREMPLPSPSSYSSPDKEPLASTPFPASSEKESKSKTEENKTAPLLKPAQNALENAVSKEREEIRREGNKEPSSMPQTKPLAQGIPDDGLPQPIQIPILPEEGRRE